ncbi:hypothetical protein PQC43_gp128 [Escherichia phage vB_EcoP-101114UKE3]|uniref:Uncharacterized protein n=1 Tax=Escherichia phage vB_EcoP-101114UKE3 TaxID=2865794 RepID=A0AAE7XSX6_9CAUD|nr:hypothetical protein PQC43_gp128 [Escherichia phage vB_EcoP-101114UKE3]QZI79256.1 hypothetical protein 101114UKE3_125 [Escherichia phage vB_EcoP-101114UKE3]USM81229.1 hypothetical protein 101114BS3_102 [Escherichia phage vB_EcoP-101114BS3]
MTHSKQQELSKPSSGPVVNYYDALLERLCLPPLCGFLRS